MSTSGSLAVVPSLVSACIWLLRNAVFMCAAAALQDPSALFRHEVAYCLGQRQDPAAIPTLQHILCDANEHSM